MAMFTAAVVACAAVLMPAAARAASAGRSHSCAVLDNGLIKCVGSNSVGQLGQGTVASLGGNLTDMGDSLPSVSLGGVNFEAVGVSSGKEFNCAISVTGAVKCWGLNDFGQLGLGDTNNRGGPAAGGLDMGDNLPVVDVAGVNGSIVGRSVESISLGGSSACAVLTDGLLKCWGANSEGQLGLGDILSRGDQADEMGDNLPFVDLGTGVTVSSVAVGSQHACAVIDDGFVKCWGNNNGGQLGYEDQTPRGAGVASNGLGAMGNSLDVVDLGTEQRAIAVGAGFFHTCALLYTGDMKCWGFGESGQLGQGSNASIGDAVGTMGDNLPPIDLGTGRTAVAVALGGAHTCAVLDDESVKCWGLNSLGSLGVGDTVSRGMSAGDMGDNLPEVPLTFGNGLGGVSNVFAGMSHSCVSGTEGGLVCFGYNNMGQLGAGTLDNLGDNPGEVEELSSIDFGTGLNVVAPESPGAEFAATPAPTGAVRDADIGGVDSDDEVSGTAVAIATSAGVVIFLLALVGVCCCCFQRRKKRRRRREGEMMAAAGMGGKRAAAGGEPKPDKRVQFSKSIRPDEDIDVHPLVRGVRLDGIVSPTGTPTMTPGISSSVLYRPKPTATPKARAAPASSDAATAAFSASPAVDSSTRSRGEAKVDSSGRAAASAASAGGSAEPLPRSAQADSTGSDAVASAAGGVGDANRRTQAGETDPGVPTAFAATGGKEEEEEEAQGFPQEWGEKKETGDAVNAPSMPPS